MLAVGTTMSNEDRTMESTTQVSLEGASFLCIRKSHDKEIVHCSACNRSYAKDVFYRHKKTCSKKEFLKHCTTSYISSTLLSENLLNHFHLVLNGFQQNEICILCRSDTTIKQISHLMWNKDKTKVDKSDEVSRFTTLSGFDKFTQQEKPMNFPTSR